MLCLNLGWIKLTPKTIKKKNELSSLADDIVKTIERENAFSEAKKQGGFIKSFKAKNVRKFFNEAWNSN